MQHRNLVVTLVLAAFLWQEAGAAARTSGSDTYSLGLDVQQTHIVEGFRKLSNEAPAEALALFDKVLSADPANELAALGHAQAQALLTNFGEAQKELLDILKANPGNVDARRLLSRLMIAVRDGESAELLLTPVVEGKPESIDYLYMGRARALQGKDELALADATAAIAADKDVRDGYLLKGYLLKRMGRGSEVPALAREMRKQNIGTDKGFFHAAILMQAAGEREEALKLLDEGLRKRPGPDSFLYRARILGNSDAAVADVRRAIRQDPKSREILLSAVVTLLAIGRYPEALEVSRELDSVAGGAADALNVGGIALWHTGEKERAIARFTQAREKAPDAQALNSLCWNKAAYDAALEEALKDCDASLAQKPDRSGTLGSRAFVLLKMGRNGESERAYDAALRANPWSASSLYGRAIARERQGNRRGAEVDASLAMTLWPGVEAEFTEYGIATWRNAEPSRPET